MSLEPGKSLSALIFATSSAPEDMSERVGRQPVARFMLRAMQPLPQQMSRISAFSVFFSRFTASSTMNSLSGRGIRTRLSTKKVSSKKLFSFVMYATGSKFVLLKMNESKIAFFSSPISSLSPVKSSKRPFPSTFASRISASRRGVSE